MAVVISVLLPTRKRPEAFARSVASLYGTAGGEMEILVARDCDDHALYPDKGDLLWQGPRYGYGALHRYYNELAAIASGDWLLLWNDDAVMVTEGWDQIVRGYEPNVVLSPHTVHDPLCTFPVIPRRFVETLGHFSLNAHCDTWWQEIAEQLGILLWPDIHVDHRRADITGENHDEVFAERRYQTEAFNSPAMRAARFADAEAIRTLLTVAA